MSVKFLNDVGKKIINASREELVKAIQGASGRVIIGETVTFKQNLIDGATNVELIKSWGCDMATINHYNHVMPMMPGLPSTEDGIKQFFSYWNEDASAGKVPDKKNVEGSFQSTFLEFGFGRTIGEVKKLAGIPVGMTLEPVTEESDYPLSRIANRENAQKGIEQGASYITMIRTPSMSEKDFAGCVQSVREGVESNGLVKAGKMPWGGSFLTNADEFIGAKEIRQLAQAGADVIVLPSPGTVPGLTVDLVRKWVSVIHECGLLAETTIGTSQEGADVAVIQRIAIDSKMTGADLFQIGDSVYGGSCSPQNVMAFAKAIKGERHVLRRMAVSPMRGELTL